MHAATRFSRLPRVIAEALQLARPHDVADIDMGCDLDDGPASVPVGPIQVAILDALDGLLKSPQGGIGVPRGLGGGSCCLGAHALSL